MLVHPAPGATLIRGDCVETLRRFGAARFDAIVTDPPYELGFMGKAWDASGIAYSVELWRECLRVLKPGGHLLAFGATRTYHRMTCAIEDADFEIRDSLHWIYGSGFPKSKTAASGMPVGQGTALKPGHEPIVMARKPLIGTLAVNIAAHGTGGLAIDACRLATTDDGTSMLVGGGAKGLNALGHSDTYDSTSHPDGRWPANVLLDEHAAAELDAQSGVTKSRQGKRNAPKTGGTFGDYAGDEPDRLGHADSGGASRFFYVAKPSRTERDRGCEHLPKRSGGEATDRADDSAGVKNPRAGANRGGGAANYHPTVKPIDLMRYLVRLVTPPGGVVLDPFCGSGTTGIAARLEGFGFLGIERDPEYLKIASARIAA